MIDRRIKHTNRDIIRWAKYYRDNTVTLMEMEDLLDVQHSTIWWCFQNRLPGLNINLYDEVCEKLDWNKRNKPIHKKERR